MVGDSMVGSSGDVNQGTTVGGGKRADRGQNLRSSDEASNDRGVKGGRNVVSVHASPTSQKGRQSAARLNSRRNVNRSMLERGDRQWAAWKQVSGTQVRAAGATLPKRPESSA